MSVLDYAKTTIFWGRSIEDELSGKEILDHVYLSDPRRLEQLCDPSKHGDVIYSNAGRPRCPSCLERLPEVLSKVKQAKVEEEARWSRMTAL